MAIKGHFVGSICTDVIYKLGSAGAAWHPFILLAAHKYG